MRQPRFMISKPLGSLREGAKGLCDPASALLDAVQAGVDAAFF